MPDPVSAWMGRYVPANHGFPYHWNPHYPARIGVMPRTGGSKDVRWFDVGPCYVFHPLNAYETETGIVLEIVRHPKVFDADLHGPNDGAPTLDRWTVDFKRGQVREERLDDRPQEFPRVDERLVGKRHRYGYSVGEDTLFKHDMTTGKTETRSFGEGNQVGEFVFEPRTPDAAEDHGVLMGLHYSAAEERSDLLLLDAETLETIATVQLPDRIPNGFHGNWVPAGN